MGKLFYLDSIIDRGNVLASDFLVENLREITEVANLETRSVVFIYILIIYI